MGVVSTIAAESLAEARRIVTERLQGRTAQIWLHGSRARGTAAPSSDIDLAILASQPLPDGLLAELRDALEESCIPYHVDIVDLARVDDAFRQRVEREGVLWIG